MVAGDSAQPPDLRRKQLTEHFLGIRRCQLPSQLHAP